MWRSQRINPLLIKLHKINSLSEDDNDERPQRKTSPLIVVGK